MTHATTSPAATPQAAAPAPALPSPTNPGAVGSAAAGPIVQSVLIVGATSGIARALAQRFAKEKYNLVLAGREQGELGRAAADLRLRYGVGATAVKFDATDFDAIPAFFDQAAAAFEGGLTGVVLCHGSMSDQKDAQSQASLTRRMIDTNFTSATLLMERAADYFEPRKAGFICALSSVAGDRGRQSNYIYGSTKAALSVFLQGLRNRLFKSGVAVVTVKPGFVDTGMTWGLLKPGSPIVAQPEKVADDIYRGIRRRKNVVYTPWFWWGIMTVITSIPEAVFKRLKL